MKHYKTLHLGILCLFVSICSLYSQRKDVFVYSTPNRATKTTDTQQHISTTTTPNYYRHHKRLSSTYTGIAVELTVSELPLKRNHSLFEQFGNVYYDQQDSGIYSYIILTDFENIRKAHKYLKQMVIHRAPDAKIIKYHKGQPKKVVIK